MMYDVIILWAWASGLFVWTQLSEKLNVLILEKNETAWNKLLLTWKWRCNFTNLNVDKSHYNWDSLDRLDKYFWEFWAQDMINYLHSNDIETKEEDHWRMFLKTNKAKQLLDFFIQRNWELNHQIKLWETVTSIKSNDDWYLLSTTKDTYSCKKIIIACWWKSFPQVGWTDYIFQFSKEFWISYSSPIPALSWIETKEDLSSLSWSSVEADITIKDKAWNILYTKNGIILFTHRWISGPVVFNATLFLTKYYQQLKKLCIKLNIKKEDMTKRLYWYLKAPKNLKNYTMTLTPNDFKWWDTAKVMSWWILMEEINDNFELKKASNIYVIWEALNVTWETWWFNLQRCWTSAYHCAKAIN